MFAALSFTLALLAAPASSQPEAAPTAEAAEYSTPDGNRVRWTSVTYQLTTGQDAATYVEVDERGSAEALLYLEGEPIIHITTNGTSSTSTWVAPDADLSPDMLAELMSEDVADAILASLADPLAFPCSEFGKGVLKAGKYVLIGLSIAGGAACCAGTGATPVGCTLCAIGAGIAEEAGSEALENYCE